MAWIIMCLSSTTLSVFGCIFTMDACSKMGLEWNGDYLYGGDEFISRVVTLFFTASNIMDLVLGFTYYATYMDPLSTTTHHICYIILVYVLLDYHFCRGFMTCFFMEIPTCLLAVGTVFPGMRSDALFGVLFLISRILFNMFLSYRLYVIYYAENERGGYIKDISVLILGLHLYWFSKWIGNYGKKAAQAVKEKAAEIKSRRNNKSPNSSVEKTT